MQDKIIRLVVATRVLAVRVVLPSASVNGSPSATLQLQVESAFHWRTQQDAQLLQGPALLLDWRACSVYISVDTEGQLLLSSETSPPMVCTGNLVVRLETARRSALLQLIDDERRVAGWICRDRATDASSAVPYVYTLRDHALALSLGLGDTEMASPSLCLAKQGVPEAVKLSVNVLAPGLEPISARSNASSFRSRVGHMFIVAKVLIEAAPFCAEVLEAVSEGVTTQSSLTCKLFVGTQGTKLEGVLSWREATRTPFTPPVRLQIDEQRREWSFHGTLRRSVLLTCPYDESERCTQVAGPALSDTASLRTGCALSGERILLPRGDGFGVVKVVAINYTSELPWKLWPADWDALECLAEMASQAGGEEATDLPIRLEICQLGRLQWFVPGLSVDGERFELVARPLGDSTEIPADDVDADKGGVADCPCYFRWNSPNHFIFAENLSWQLCRSRDLAKTLHRLPAMLEFGRLCEQLSAESWKIHTIGTTTFGVELQGMGIEFRVADEGLVCRCLSRRNNRLAPVPNVKGFVCMLSSYAGSAAKGNVFEYTPGKLASQSSSLWAYLRSVRVLYQVFASLRKGLARWSLAGEDVHESMCREEHRIQWGLLEREVPALGATCGLEVRRISHHEWCQSRRTHPLNALYRPPNSRTRNSSERQGIKPTNDS